ncbi:hypothetical protein ABPG75_013273 [Micractinium tetrahymenae]
MATTLALAASISPGLCARSEPRRLPAAPAPAQLRRQAGRAVTVRRAAGTQTMVTEALTQEEFEVMLKEQPATLVDFYATWCGPCKLLASHMSKIEPEYAATVRFEKIDTTKNYELAKHYRITKLPTLLLFQGTEQVDRIEGVLSAQDLDLRLRSKLQLH